MTYTNYRTTTTHPSRAAYYQAMRYKPYGIGMFLIDLFLTILTSGVWLLLRLLFWFFKNI